MIEYDISLFECVVSPLQHGSVHLTGKLLVSTNGHQRNKYAANSAGKTDLFNSDHVDEWQNP